MRLRFENTTLVLAALLALGAAAPAAADHRPRPFDVAATITSCGGDGLTVAAEIEPATAARNRKVAERAVRTVRRATLRLRFQAAPLYGRVRRSREINVGRTTSARRFERFGDLPAQTYAGVVHYRWVRGSRTLLSGKVKTRRESAAGRRGKAFCSLRVGKPPRDTQPPLIAPLPSDGAWRRGPLNVYMWAIDDLSGVALVVTRVDNGPFVRGRRVQIATEGAHRLAYVARDAAGNQSTPGAVTLRVDMNPPTEPTITSPATTSDTTPDITWTASTDSGSGVQGYFALVRDATGAIVWSQVVRGASNVHATVSQTLNPGNYTAEVIAVDGAGPNPFTTKATSAFTVTSGTAATPASLDSDSDGKADTEDNCPTASNADQLNTDRDLPSGDAQGDVCDGDDDADTVADGGDNCPVAANQSQADFDGDAQGDACDDADGDGALDARDNCRTTANASQANNDGDAAGDACDSDDDNDGIDDGPDACEFVHRGDDDLDGNGCPGLG